MKHLIEWHENYVNALSKRSLAKYKRVKSLEEQLDQQFTHLENKIDVLKESIMKISNEKIIRQVQINEAIKEGLKSFDANTYKSASFDFVQSAIKANNLNLEKQ